MPHTSHKKRQQRPQGLFRTKRGEIQSDDGWTKISRSDKALSINHQTDHQNMAYPPDDPDYNLDLDEGCTRVTFVFPPAEIPEGASWKTALDHYQKCENEWRQSNTWAGLKQIFDSQIFKQDLDITSCICFGLSSPTGLLGATADRRNVSMYQLAVFKSVIDMLSKKQGQRPEAFAQEPIFNTLDVQFLSHLNISVVEHPAAFELITSNTFAFCPGAEQFIVRGTLFRSPAMYMGSGALETYREPETGDLRSPQIGSVCLEANPQDPIIRAQIEEMQAQEKEQYRADAVRGAEILHHFKKGKEVFKLPDTAGFEYALYDAHLFWRSSNAQEEED